MLAISVSDNSSNLTILLPIDLSKSPFSSITETKPVLQVIFGLSNIFVKVLN